MKPSIQNTPSPRLTSPRPVRRTLLMAICAILITLSPELNAAAGSSYSKACSTSLIAATLTMQDPPTDAVDEDANADDQFNARNDAGLAEEDVNLLPEYQTHDTAISRATELLMVAAKVYKTTPGIRDAVKVRTLLHMMGETQETESDVTLVISSEGTKLILEDMQLIAIDGTLYGTWEERSDRVFVSEFVGPVSSDLFIDRVPIFPFPQIPLAYSNDPIQDMFIFTVKPTVSGIRSFVDPDTDKPCTEVQIVSGEEGGADIELRFDDETHLATRFRTMLTDPGLEQGDGMELIVEIQSTILDVVPLEEFIIDVEGKREVNSIYALTAPPSSTDLMGKAAPAFELETLDGNSIQSDDLMGHVVILVFWQIQYESLFPILGPVDNLVEWIEENGLAAKVVLINTGDTQEMLESFWEEFGSDISTTSDPEMEIATVDYMIPSVPIAIIIGADGIVHQVISDIDIEPLPQLKTAITETLNKGL